MPDQQITGTLTGTFTVTLAGSGGGGGPVLPLPPQPKADRYVVTGVELYRNASDGTWTIDGSRLTFTPDPLSPTPPPVPPATPTDDAWPGVTLPDAGTFVDRAGATWTMDAAGTVRRDGVPVGWDATRVTAYAGVIYQLYQGKWYYWDELAPGHWPPAPFEGDPVPAEKPKDEQKAG